MARQLWRDTTTGRLLVDAQGRPLFCEECPCGSQPAAGCSACGSDPAPAQYRCSLTGIIDATVFCPSCPTLDYSQTINFAPLVRPEGVSCFWFDFAVPPRWDYPCGGDFGAPFVDAEGVTGLFRRFALSLYEIPFIYFGTVPAIFLPPGALLDNLMQWEILGGNTGMHAHWFMPLSEFSCSAGATFTPAHLIHAFEPGNCTYREAVVGVTPA